VREQDRLVIEKLVNGFSKLPHLEAIILFGSLARGQADERSDIDLLLIFSHPKPEGFLEQVTGIINEVNPHREVRPVLSNLQDYDRDFLHNALREGKTLFGKVVVSSDMLGLRPYRAFSYSLVGNTPKEKQAIHRLIYGYRVKTVKGGKVYVSKKEGMVDRGDIKILGRGVIAVPEEEAARLEETLKRFHVQYTTTKIFL